MRTFALVPNGPFSFDLARSFTCGFSPMTRFAEVSNDDALRLGFVLDGSHEEVAVAVRWDGATLRGDLAGTGDVATARAQVARIFSLDHDAHGFAALGEREPRVGALQAALPGLRPVCFTSPYETAVWAVISQRIASAEAARILAGITARCGTEVHVAGRAVPVFPRPERLLGHLAVAGDRAHVLARLPEPKRVRLAAVAHAALEGRLDAARLRGLGVRDALASLQAIPGIGPFWSQGVYLRGAGVVDVFPDEPRSLAALSAVYGLGARPTRLEVDAVTRRLAPFRTWACFLLRVAHGRGLACAA